MTIWEALPTDVADTAPKHVLFESANFEHPCSPRTTRCNGENRGANSPGSGREAGCRTRPARGSWRAACSHCFLIGLAVKGAADPSRGALSAYRLQATFLCGQGFRPPFVSLSCAGRRQRDKAIFDENGAGPRVLASCCDADSLAPCSEGRRPQFSIRVGGNEMAAGVERVVDGGVGGQETLGGSG
jgi:hypothetical protein